MCSVCAGSSSSACAWEACFFCKNKQVFGVSRTVSTSTPGVQEGRTSVFRGLCARGAIGGMTLVLFPGHFQRQTHAQLGCIFLKHIQITVQEKRCRNHLLKGIITLSVKLSLSRGSVSEGMCTPCRGRYPGCCWLGQKNPLPELQGSLP